MKKITAFFLLGAVLALSSLSSAHAQWVAPRYYGGPGWGGGWGGGWGYCNDGTALGIAGIGAGASIINNLITTQAMRPRVVVVEGSGSGGGGASPTVVVPNQGATFYNSPAPSFPIGPGWRAATANRTPAVRQQVVRQPAPATVTRPAPSNGTPSEVEIKEDTVIDLDGGQASTATKPSSPNLMSNSPRPKLPGATPASEQTGVPVSAAPPKGFLAPPYVQSPWSNFKVAVATLSPGQLIYDPETGQPFLVP